jgi:TerB N-terminal domain
MGLERRVIESRGRASALSELNRLAAEMRRLVETHGMDSFSLHHHATRLAALVEMQSMSERMYKRPVPTLHRTYDLPVELRLALGQVAHDQAPLPVAWALAWLLVDQTFHLRSPMTRCPDEFRRLFEARYGERFGAGLQLPNNGRKLLLTYMPVSRMLASADGYHFAVDSALDVDASCAAAGELRTLCSLCAEDLFEYCRYVGRHPLAVESPDTELRLPAAIRPAAVKARIAELRLACQAGRQPANLHEVALALWGEGMADNDSAGLLQALLVAEGITVGPRPGRALGSTATGSH